MKNFFNQSLPYLQKLVMVSTLIITIFLPMAVSVNSTSASTLNPRVYSSDTREGTLTINLTGVTSYKLAEIFNNVIKTTPGVIETRRCQLYLDPKRPRSSQIEWQVTFTGTTPFVLESSIYNRLKEISGNSATPCMINGTAITLSDHELQTLKAIKPWQATTRRLRFIETEIFAGNLPQIRPSYGQTSVNRWSDYPNYGFE